MRAWARGGTTRACPMAETRAAGEAAGTGFKGSPVQVGVRWQVVRGHAHGLRGPMLVGSMRWPARMQLKADALAPMVREVGGVEDEEVQRCLANGLDLDAFLALV